MGLRSAAPIIKTKNGRLYYETFNYFTFNNHDTVTYKHAGDRRNKKNKLTTLPPEFGKLPCIGFLHLQDNEIVTLPEEMSRITYSISEIYLEGNPIELSNVPEALRDFLEN